MACRCRWGNGLGRRLRGISNKPTIYHPLPQVVLTSLLAVGRAARSVRARAPARSQCHQFSGDTGCLAAVTFVWSLR